MKLFAKQISELTTKNANYRDFVMKLLDFLVKEDVGGEDKTTQLLAKPNVKVRAKILAKESGMVCGVEEIAFFLRKKGVEVVVKKKDGSLVKRGEIVLILEGSARKILTHERVVLNLLQRMSGIATTSIKLARKIGKGKFSATRKTPYGLLDTKAVVVGGGLPHRLSLSDMILVKENHIKIDSECWKRVRTKDFFEVEADSEKLAKEIATHFSKSKNLILLLDNFTPKQLQTLTPKLREINHKIILEGSGGITARNAKQFLTNGVDYISLGEITHSVKVLDFSLKFCLRHR